MKKLVAGVLLLGLAVAFPLSTRAKGIEAGQQMIALSVGGAMPLEKAGFSAKDIGFTDDQEMKWGKVGATAGLSYMYFPSAYFGVGLEGNDAYFVGKKYTTEAAGDKYETKTGMNVSNVLLSMRLNVNPKSKYRFYVPFGGGYSWSVNLLEQKNTVGGTTTKDTYHVTTGGFGYFGGLGFEMDLGKRWSLGLEARYNGFLHDTDKIAKTKDNKPKLVGDKDYTYVSGALQIGYHF